MHSLSLMPAGPAGEWTGPVATAVPAAIESAVVGELRGAVRLTRPPFHEAGPSEATTVLLRSQQLAEWTCQAGRVQNLRRDPRRAALLVAVRHGAHAEARTGGHLLSLLDLVLETPSLHNGYARVAIRLDSLFLGLNSGTARDAADGPTMLRLDAALLMRQGLSEIQAQRLLRGPTWAHLLLYGQADQVTESLIRAEALVFGA